MSNASGTAWALRLFSRSVLKQQKWAAIRAMLGDTQGLSCLDIGSDNGVISYLLRQRGGTWTSADLDEQAVASIRALVQSNVVWLDGARLPFADGAFDRVVLIDCLEHVRDDQAFIAGIARITKPEGEIIVNVPLRKDSWLRGFRVSIGQTDEAHGHVRSGYTAQELRGLWSDVGEVLAATTYSRFFSEAIDTVMTWAIRTLKRRPTGDGMKGTIVTAGDLARHRSAFALYTLLYPLFWATAQLDRLLWWRSGYMLIAKVRLSPKPAAVVR